MKTLTEDLNRIYACIGQWLEIREEHGESLKETYADQLRCDMQHSSLLCRLVVQQKEPLPIPPPCAYSYPWYSLIETGNDENITDFHDYDKAGHYPGYVAIAQSLWKIEKRVSDDEFLLRYRYKTRDKTFTDSPDVWHLTLNPPSPDKPWKSWTIKRHTQEN
jgi:hypothetical protein